MCNWDVLRLLFFVITLTRVLNENLDYTMLRYLLGTILAICKVQLLGCVYFTDNAYNSC